MSEIKLKGQTFSGELVKFNISQVFDVCLRNNLWYVKGYPNDYIIDTATIQLAEDPRKAMLDGLRLEINKLREYKSFVRVEGDPVPTLPQIAKWCVIWILDEMEAKL